MKKIVLHGEMADLFGSEIDLDVSSPHEAIHALCMNFKDFRRYVIQKSLSGVSYSFIDSKDNKYDGYCGHIILKDDRYDIIASPQGHGGMMGAMGSFFGSNPLGAGIANAAMGFGMQKLVSKFTKDTIQEDDVPEHEIIETNSFIYSQNENKTEQGSPVPVIYGQLRVGTKVINSSVENYDYDNDDAFIYETPPELNQIDLIHGGKYSFIVSPSDEDFRSTTTEDAFQTYSLEGKRRMTFGANGAKQFDPDIGNEGQHESFDEGNNDYGAAHKASFGPSSNRPLKRSAGQSSFKETDTVRPYVFPPQTQIDYWMRPQGRDDLSVERTLEEGVSSSESLAWVGPSATSDQMRIGNRGNFQKLESIGLYKSLEVLSEGPIGGLAMPISSDAQRDNGRITYPLEVSDSDGGSNAIKLGNLKYHDYVSDPCQLADATNNDETLTILSAGTGYTTIAGVLLNGTYSVEANAIGTPSHSLKIRVDAPNVSYAAKINDTSFEDSELFEFGNRSYYMSYNKIFLIDPDDGTVIANMTGNGNTTPLPNKYYDGNSFDLVELDNDPPLIHPDVNGEEIDFFVGENYANGNTTFTISPENNKVEFNFEVQPTEHTEDIYSKAQAVDLGALMGYDIIGQTVASSFREFEAYADSEEIPGALNQESNPYTWSQMCRIYQKGATTLNADPENQFIYIPVGFLARKDGLAFNPDTSSNTHFQSLVYYGQESYSFFVNGSTITPNVTDQTSKAQIYLKLSLAQYLGLQEIPEEWNDWENWLLKFGSTYIPIHEYVQNHTFKPDPSSYPQWSEYNDYFDGAGLNEVKSIVTSNGYVYTPRLDIQGNPFTDSYPNYSRYYDYPLDARIQYEGEAYKATKRLYGSPNNINFDYFDPTMTYSEFASDAAIFSPEPSNYNINNTVKFPTADGNGFFNFKRKSGGRTSPFPNAFDSYAGTLSNTRNNNMGPTGIWTPHKDYDRGDILYVEDSLPALNLQESNKDSHPYDLGTTTIHPAVQEGDIFLCIKSHTGATGATVACDNHALSMCEHNIFDHDSPETLPHYPADNNNPSLWKKYQFSAQAPGAYDDQGSFIANNDWVQVRADATAEEDKSILPAENPANTSAKWQLISKTSLPLPIPQKEWDPYSSFASGECVQRGEDFYCTTGAIAGATDPSSFSLWDAQTAYSQGGDIDGAESQVLYNGIGYQLKVGVSISPEDDNSFMTDNQVEALYNTDVQAGNSPSNYAPTNEGGVNIWPSVPIGESATYTNQPNPTSDTTRWEPYVANATPEANSDWQLNSQWKAFQSTFSEVFKKDDYYIQCDYARREGVIQNPDPSPKSPGFLAGLFSKVKYVRQSRNQNHIDLITQTSQAWRRLMNGDGVNLGIGDLLREDYQYSEEGGNTAAFYETKVKKTFGGSEVNHSSAAGTTLLYSQGPDFNDKIIALFGTALLPTDSLESKEARYSNSRQGSFGGSVDAAAIQINRFRSNQTRHLRFTVGSGGTKQSGSSFTYADSFPSYMTLGSKEGLGHVSMFREGYNDRDDTANPYGFYDDKYYPRVTVFILRLRQNGRLDLCPTTIEAVAKVNGTDGIISNLYMLNSPTYPVYDTETLSENSNGFTNISPQSVDNSKYTYQSEGKFYQDVGVYLRIDATHGYHSVRFDVNAGSLQGISSPENGSFGLNTSWKEHLVSDAVGISREFPIMDDQQEIYVRNMGNTTAKIRVSTETALSTSGYTSFPTQSSGLPTTVNTGRVKSFAITSAGNSYLNRFQGYIYNQRYIVKNITSTGSERGYKPNTSFIVFGIPKSKYDENPTDPYKFAKFKARVYVNKYGRIQQDGDQPYAVRIIDSGYTLENEEDEIVFLDAAFHDDLNGSRINTIANNVYSNNGRINATINESEFLTPETHLTKIDMKINAFMQDTIVKSFSVAQNGLGFNSYETIKDPFQIIQFIAPKFNLTFSSGKLTSANLDKTHATSGYSPADTRVRARVSRPYSPPGVVGVDDPENDPYDKFRSIYLNDVPIRDHTDRFNYSKFHFDMRIGHYKNHHNQHVIKGTLAPLASDQLMSMEFRIPTHTKFVNYPLFGPRNEGEKDYYYSHTVKNPEISDISFSIKIDQLHYIYEGDESAVYLNLLPILGMVLGYMLGKWLMEKAISFLFPDMTVSFGVGVSTGFSIPSFSQAFEIMAAAAAYAAIQAGGIILALLAFKWISKVFKCSKIPWLCIKIGNKIKNSGEIWPAKMRFAIEYGVEGSPLKKDEITFRGCATSAYVKDIFINDLPAAQAIGVNSEVKKNRIFRVYRLTRELDPVTGGLTEARYKIGAELLSVTEYVGGYFSYPNTALIGTRLNSKDHPSLPRREYLIKGRLIKVPSNYSPISGTYDGAWNGQFDSELQWTSNPAWIIFDLLTNERYGMGKYGIKEEDVDKWSFYKFAQRCDEKIDVIVDGQATQERRHMCNLYIDSERQAYDYIRDLMSIYNTKINFTAGTIHIVQDAPTDSGPVMLFNNSNASEEGFSYSSTPETDRITAATVDFVDERDNYMRKTEYVEDPEGVREHGYSHVKIAGIGITRRGEAHRLAWHKILTKQLEKELVFFKTGIRASYLRIGDVIEVMDNNKVSNHSGGRISSISGNTIEIDVPVEALGNTAKIYIELPVQTYDVWVANQSFIQQDVVLYDGLFYENTSGSNGSTTPNEDTSNWQSVETIRQKQFAEYTISNKSGFNVTLGQTIDSDIQSGFTWIVKENDEDKCKPAQYKIKQIKEVSPLTYEVAATEHVEDKYNQVDNSAGAQEGIEFESREYYGPPISTA